MADKPKESVESLIAIASINKWLEENACEDVDRMGYVSSKAYVVNAEEIYQSVQSLLSAKLKKQRNNCLLAWSKEQYKRSPNYNYAIQNAPEPL